MIGRLLQFKIDIFYGKTMVTVLPVEIAAAVLIVPAQVVTTSYVPAGRLAV